MVLRHSANEMVESRAMWRMVVGLMLVATAAVAQPGVPLTSQGVPPGANPETGARPGNEIGTGQSLPLSNNSGNIGPQDTQSVIAPNLPSPDVGENAPARDYLTAARAALLLDHTGEAQQALEMAETRALDRSVPLFQTNTPSDNPLVAEIRKALEARAGGDREQTVRLIEAALKDT
jgi:hypothetical protein